MSRPTTAALEALELKGYLTPEDRELLFRELWRSRDQEAIIAADLRGEEEKMAEDIRGEEA